MLQKLNKNREGFTIIEVLIVLAIAGLILLIVFLAVPALQRNARNTQRKNDVAGVLGGISDFVNNNGGNLPTGCGGTSPITWTGPAGSASSQAKVGYYNKGCVTAGPAAGDVYLAAASTVVPALTFIDSGHDYIEIIPGDSCNGSASQTGSARGIVAVFEVENGSGTFAQQCQES